MQERPCERDYAGLDGQGAQENFKEEGYILTIVGIEKPTVKIRIMYEIVGEETLSHFYIKYAQW